jgi:type II secretion system protein D
MPRLTSNRLLVSVLLSAFSLPDAGLAQDAAQPSAPTSPVQTHAGPALSFNFKDAAVDQVLDFFARQSGLPVIYEAAIPTGTITFVSSSTYSFEEALSILNLNLARYGVHLRLEGKFLYLSTLQDAMKKAGAESADPARLAVLPPDRYVTVSIPLDNAKAEQVAEQVKAMVGPHGGVLPIPTQNMIVVVESVAQVKRIREVVEAIDARKPADAAFRLFPLQYAQCEAVLNALKGLMSERSRTVIVDKDGSQRVVQDTNIQGLNLAADPRTNSIVAVGPEARIKLVSEVIALLDVPEGLAGASVPGESASGVEVRTFSLRSLTADEAARQVGALFAAMDPKRRPIIIPLPQQARLTVAGPRGAVSQAEALLKELDPGSVIGDMGEERRVVRLALKNANPVVMEGLVTRLGSPRQQQVVRVAPAPDGKSLLIMGPAPDVEAVQGLVAALDVPAEADREVRVVRIAKGEAPQVLAKAQDLYAKTGRAERDPVVATIDENSRSATLVGSRAALTEFTGLLQTLESVSPTEQEARRFQLKRAKPSILAGKVARIARSMLAPANAADYAEPLFEPLDDLAMLVVRAQPSQFEVIATLIEQLDAVVEKNIRVFPVANEKASVVRDRALSLYEAQSAQVPNTAPVEVSVDDRANALIVVADAESMQRFARVMDELNRQGGPTREVRLIDLKIARAADVAAFLRDLAASSESLTVRGGAEPIFEVIESTNQLLVAATPAQLSVIESLARNMDTRQGGERPPLRILKLRTTDAANLSQVLQRSYDARSPEDRLRRPVTIEADPATNTLIVSAHPDVLSEVEEIASQLNETEAADATGREIRVFPLKIARAEELAQTIDQMYPEPPVPLDPRTRQPRPDLKQPREVIVRADRATNSLIVDAPSRRLAGFEQLVRSLDQAKLADNVSLRTYRIQRADLNALVRTLRDLAASGSLGNQGATGPITVSSDPPTRTLIVSGPPEVFPAVEDVLGRVDAKPDAPSTDLKLYALAHAQADRISPLVERILTTRARELLNADGKGVAEGHRLVEVSADTASNTLILSAPAPVLVIADGVIRALDQQAVSSAVEVRVFRLAKGEAPSVATALAAALKAQDRPGTNAATVTPEPASNTIVVVGSSEQIERAGKLVETMDAAVDREGMGVRTITLRHSRAETLAPVLEGVLARESALDRLPDWARAQVLSRGTPEPARVRVVAEPRLNAIVISGPRAVIDMAEQVVAELDVEGGNSVPSRLVRVIPLQNAEASQLATNLESIFRDPSAAEPPPVIRVDPGSNSLIVRASEAQMATVEELARQLDANALQASRQMRTIAVDPSRADAELLARALKRLLEQQGGARVELISAEELMKRARSEEEPPTPKKSGMLAPRPGMPPMVIMLIATAFAQPSATSEASSPVSGQPVPQPLARSPVTDPSDTGVTIAVDKATNTILVVGSPRMADRLVQLARTLENQLPPEPAGVKIVEVPTGVDADQIAQIVRQTVSQIGRYSTTNTGGFTGPVNVMADPSGGSLIVLSNETDFETVARLIAATSRGAPSAKVTVKVYPLSNISAQRAIQSVQDLFSTQPRGAQARRVRELEIAVSGDAGAAVGRIDISQVRLAPAPGGAGIVVAAPDEAMPVIDRLIETLDQTPVRDRLAIRRYDVQNARADDLARTLQTLLDAQRQGTGADAPAARVLPDARTNTIIVAASDAQHRDVARLLAEADVPMRRPDEEVAILTLRQAAPSTVRRMVDEVLVAKDPARRERIHISAEDTSSVLVVRAPKEDLDEVRTIVAQVDQAETGGLPVRSIKLERADAGAVASSLQQFFRDRAAARGGARGVNRVAIVGDRRSGTLVVSAGEDDFAQVEELVRTLDSPTPARDMVFRIVQLRHARVGEVGTTIKTIIDEMRWETMWGPQREERVEVRVELNPRTNSIVLVGRGEAVEVAERVVQALDLPDEARAAVAVKSVRVRAADLNAMRNVLQRAFATPGWQAWRGTDPEALTVEVDRAQRALVLVGRKERVEQAAAYIAELDQGPDGAPQQIEAISLQHAQADRVANSLRQFFTDRARMLGVDSPGVSIIGSRDGNVVIVSGDGESIRQVRDLVAQIDQPDGGRDRRIEVVVLKNAVANDTANALRAMFARPGKEEDRVVITPQPSTNSLIVSAPASFYPEVRALLDQLDAAPRAEETNIETIALASVRATEAAQALRTALPPNVKVTITPILRSNSLMLTGSREAIAIVLEQVRKIDTEPVRSGLVFRRFRLQHADAADVSYTVERMLEARPTSPTEPTASLDYNRDANTVTAYAPADQIDEIERIIRELDEAPAEERQTEFIKLQYANATQTANALKVFYGRTASEAASAAARNVTILPDELSNSLVIRADKSQWEGIRALLAKLDTRDYDTTRQLAVIPLIFADAVSVARALNEGLRAPLEEQLRQAQIREARIRQGQPQRPGDRPEATVLIDAQGVPTVSAEPQTNSLIVFAGGRDLERIRDIVRQLDVAGFADMPTPRIIPLRSGKPSLIAQHIRELYLNRTDRSGADRTSGPRAVVVIGDDSSGALIVRADEERFAEIKALAATLEQQGEIGRVSPHVIRLRNVAAGRLRTTILVTFAETAKSMGETLAVEVDRASNSLVVACSSRLLEEIRKVVEELDQPAFGVAPDGTGAGLVGQNVTIVDVQNNDPADIKRVLDDMGLTRPQQADRPGVVSEQVTISVLTTRRALAVVGSPGDGKAVESLVRALDAAPLDAQQQVMIVPLRVASATTLAATLTGMLRVDDPAAGQTGPARALTEHIRRLQLVKAGANQPSGLVDLSRPVKILADNESNSIIITSTRENIDALVEVIRVLDALPTGDAVVMRIFPLENASAPRVQTVIEQLFRQGEELRRIPGTRRQGLPPTATGQALAGEIAVAVDDRTNTLIVAGREEAVALVDVVIKELDGDRVSKWVEPLIIPLRHADARTLAERLNTVLVRGLSTTPEAAGLQRQFGRLRMLADAPPTPEKPANFLQADLFAPVTGLVIVPEENMNALLIVGTPANNAVVRRLVEQLDVESASAANTVRIFPLRFAAAERVAAMLRDIFRQRTEVGTDRPEDRLIVTTDVRTNALVISTSARSFAIVEGLLKTLDGEQTNYSVGLHVIPVTTGDVRQLATRIERLMRERIAAAAQVGSIRNALDAFSIEPEPVSNALIVACSDENLTVVKELIAALTGTAQDLAAGQRVDIVQLSRVRASEAAEQITQMFVEKENQRRGQAAVRVIANERLNALVVSGDERDIAEVRALAARLDEARVTQRHQIRALELRSANAGEVVRLVQNVLTGRPMGGGSGLGARQATRLQFLRDTARQNMAGETRPEPTEAELDGAIREQVTLTADARTNTVWITAPEAMMRLISEMVRDIDESSAGARRIEKFRLVNADAIKMRDLLRDIFQLRQDGEALVLVPSPGSPRDQEPPVPEGTFVDGATLTPVPDERMQLSIAVDERTNTLIVSGTEEYLSLVRKVVTELDSVTAAERERRVVQLRNARAKEIETTLKTYFQGEVEKERLTLGAERAGSLMRRLEQEVTIVGDEASNNLVIATSPRYMDTVLRIVRELDQTPPQVMIQVLLAEVTVDSSEQWGMDAKLGPFGGEGYTISHTAQGVGVATALGVPNLSVTSADFGVLIRALELQGKLEILSNPHVLANNNKQASIKVVDNIGLAGQTERGFGTNTIVSTVERQDVGIILNVTPSISSDGFIRMEIMPEISSLTQRTTQINRDQTAPIITKRTVETVVTVKDGQSVVIGGLIQTTDDNRRSKVPLLGDIPILGLPFRTKQNTMNKTELLVILTPRVIPNDPEHNETIVRDVTEQQINRLDDPTRIEEFLERVRKEIEVQKARDGYIRPPDAPQNSISPAPTDEDRPVIPGSDPRREP